MKTEMYEIVSAREGHRRNEKRDGWMEHLDSRDDGISYGVRWRHPCAQSNGWDSRSRVQIEFLFLGHFPSPSDSSAQLQTPPTEKMERSGLVVRIKYSSWTYGKKRLDSMINFQKEWN